MAVEKGTKAVISANFTAYGEQTFNNLRTNFFVEIPRKEFFNSHRRLHSKPPNRRKTQKNRPGPQDQTPDEALRQRPDHTAFRTDVVVVWFVGT